MANFHIDTTTVTETVKAGFTTAKDSVEFLGRNVVAVGQKGMTLAGTAMTKVSALVQTLWESMRPMLTNTISWIKTPMGLCGLSLAGTFYAIFKMAPEETDSTKKMAYNAMGVGLAVLCGILGAQAGVFKVPAVLSA